MTSYGFRSLRVTFFWMIKRQRWIRGPDLPSKFFYGPGLIYKKQTCSSALNSTSLVIIGEEKGLFVQVFDFVSKKWEENPGIQEFLYLESYYANFECTSTTTFSKDSKQKLMVLISK